jgi:SPP1 family predicted phage head-tail adaptor
MRSGQYRHFCDIEVNRPLQGQRGPVDNWLTLYSSVPMSIDALAGRLIEIAKQLVPSATHKVGLRYLSGIVAGETRINYGGRLFYVGYVDEWDFRGRYLTLTCTEQQGGL